MNAEIAQLWLRMRCAQRHMFVESKGVILRCGIAPEFAECRKKPDPNAGIRIEKKATLERFRVMGKWLAESKAQQCLAWGKCQWMCLSTVKTSTVGTMDELRQARKMPEVSFVSTSPSHNTWLLMWTARPHLLTRV